MEHLGSDLLMNMISYLSVIDSSSFSSTSRRLYYLTNQFRRILGPQIATSSSSLAWENDQRRPNDNYKNCLSRMRSKPNFALTFTVETGSDLCFHLHKVAQNNLVLLGAEALAIQANCEGRIEHDIDAALMLGTFLPERTSIVPFCYQDPDRDESHKLINLLNASTPPGESVTSYWKVFIVYAAGEGSSSVDVFVSGLQQNHPESTVVGGICASGYVTMEPTKEYLGTKCIDELEAMFVTNGGIMFNSDSHSVAVNQVLHSLNGRRYVLDDVEDGIFGIAFGGDVPVRSIVSRGVTSVTSGNSSGDIPSRFIVQDVLLARRGDAAYLYEGDESMLKPIHIIESILDKHSNKIVSPASIMANIRRTRPEFFGFRRQHADGYELHPLSPFSVQANRIVLMTDGSVEQELSLQGAEVDFFVLNGTACREDLNNTLKMLKSATANQIILGGLMFSCNGRGPEKQSMLREEMADARCFFENFPDVSLCGFYAYGEIGPMAMAGKCNVFQSGKAAVQGFTAVFALFIVPAVEPGAFHIDDSPENISTFMKQSLKPR